ncbi:2,3-bisphosphoglycerate-independent phosphoglycerate mutase [Ruminococcaceae bacterium OttesenSCG-928-D13]|nr:2,3-bisphosphoglycerate-independent phosphoglycerate mutase [Ruminococcaceae bacterium OttesenSCG-928-D13]
MKYLIVIGDGMADNPVPALGGKTPLETAKKPAMDELAQKGELGTVRTVPEGVPPGSDTAILSIFGYDPRQFFTGRSPLEAAGSGVTLEDGDISYRCNMITLEDGDKPLAERKILSHSGGSVHGEDALALMGALLADERFAAVLKKQGITIHPTPTFRHITVQKGADITGLVAAEPHQHLGEPVGPLLPAGAPVAAGLAELMEIAPTVLDHHPVNERRRAEGKLPANGIWFWAEGRAVALPDFKAAHGGKSGMVVSAVPLVQGIARLAGLDVTEVEGATGELDTNYEGKANAILKAFADGYEFALVHVESPDECTHNGDTPGKLQAIEWVDSRTLVRLRAGLDKAGEPWRLLLLSDHKTLTATRGHDGDPVPYLIYDSRQTAPGSGLAYTEANAEKGPHIEIGSTLINHLFEEK